MKKILAIALIALLALTAFVSCKSEPEPETPTGDGFVHVETFAQFVKAFTSAPKTEKKTIVLDVDLEFDAKTYPGAATPAEGTALIVDATGLTIDLGGHKITGIPLNALNLLGDSFTVKNGSFVSTGDNNRYALCISYRTDKNEDDAAAAKPAAYSDSDAKWKKRIVLDNISATGCLIGTKTVEIKNSTFDNPNGYRGLVMQGASGIIQDCTIKGSSSSGLTVYGYNTVTLKGTISAESNFGIHVTYGGNAIIDEGATVTLKGNSNYGLYFENEAGTVTTKKNSTLIINSKSENVIFAKSTSTTCILTIDKDSTVKDANGSAILSLTVKNPSNGTITDNRVIN